jgi:hypothetical protein
MPDPGVPRSGTESTPGVPRLPIAIIGAGPTGLSAAAHVLARGGTPLVFEMGSSVGTSVRAWSHVRVFSPWKYLVDPVMRRMLEAAGWSAPMSEGLPTGGELVERLLEPFAELPDVAPHLRFNSRVVAVARHGFDRVRTAGREAAPFEVVVRGPAGAEYRVLVRAVIDASGTWTLPNPLGSSGLPAPGELQARARIRYGIPDVLGAERRRYAGRRVLVVGSGHSAFNALLDLSLLREQEGAGALLWAVRRRDTRHLFGGEEKDELAARASLGMRLRDLVLSEQVGFLTGFEAERVETLGDTLLVRASDGRAAGPVDEVVVATGFRPDPGLARELRLRLDEVLEAPVALAPLIDPNVHSCGTVYPHGYAELSHPEQDYYVVGMKSYGRAPTFLLLTGYEQVRSVVAALHGDMEAAANVELVLPATGVCSSDAGDASCCGTASPAPEPANGRPGLPVVGVGCCS